MISSPNTNISNYLTPNSNTLNNTYKSNTNTSKIEEEVLVNNNNNTNFFSDNFKIEDMPIIPDSERENICSKLEEIFNNIYDKNSLLTAKKTSKLEREKNKHLGVDLSYVYSEITFKSFCYIFEYYRYIIADKLNSELSFLDCGSGSGKAVVAASLLYPFKKCVGIEKLKDLNSLANKYIITYNVIDECNQNSFLFPFHKQSNAKNTNELNNSVDDNLSSLNEFNYSKIELKSGDFLDENWEEYNFIFINSTAFSEELMIKIEDKTKELKSNAVLVTVSKRIPEHPKSKWKLYDGFKLNFNFGPATIYFHKLREIVASTEKESKDGISMNSIIRKY